VKKTNRASVVERIVAALDANNPFEAINIAKREYPWEPATAPVRKMTRKRAFSVFIKDGFIDRYSGSRLVFPGTLLLLGKVVPDAFPAHRNWRVSETHDVYFELWPVVDHVDPVARGGRDDESNYVTTSNLNNDVKSSWSLEQLGWKLYPPGHMDEWDGLMAWFLTYARENPQILEDQTIKGWFRTAKSISVEG
jgi:hypothetical protein